MEGKKGKVLVIDDNEDILFALNLLLKPLVEDIRVTKLPEQIDRFYDMLHPDVVLTDTEIAGVTSIKVNEKNIQSLKGIEYFTALKAVGISEW